MERILVNTVRAACSVLPCPVLSYECLTDTLPMRLYVLRYIASPLVSSPVAFVQQERENLPSFESLSFTRMAQAPVSTRKAKVCELIYATLRSNHGTETGNAQHSDEGILDELDSSKIK